MKTKDRMLRAAFVSVALGLAWSLRGHYGGIMGVGLCGAVLGMGFAYVSGQRAMFKWMPLLGAVAALALCPTVTYYEPFHAYSSNKTFVNYAYGLFMLILQGGGWACFACCFIGLMLEKEPLKAQEWASVIATIFVSAFVFHYVVVDLLGIHLTFGPPYAVSRSGFPTDKVIGVNGGVIGLLVWLILSKKRYGLKAAIIGYISFGLGMSGGRFLANVRDYSTWWIGDWHVLGGIFKFGNIMEILVGLIGGFLFTYGMLGKKAPEFPDKDKHYKLLSVYSILFLLTGIPIMFRVLRIVGSRLDTDTGLIKIDKWAKLFQTYGYDEPMRHAERIPGIVTVVCIFAFVATIIWLFLYLRNKHRFGAFPIICLLAAVVVIQNLDWQYLVYPVRVVPWKMFLFPAMVVFLILHTIFVKTPEITEPDEVAEHVNWRKWVIGAVIAYVVMVVLSGPVNAGRQGDEAVNHMRFPAGDRTPIPWRSNP